MNKKLQEDELITEALDTDPNAKKIKELEISIDEIDKKLKKAKNKQEKKAFKEKRKKLIEEYEKTQKLMEKLKW